MKIEPTPSNLFNEPDLIPIPVEPGLRLLEEVLAENNRVIRESAQVHDVDGAAVGGC